MIRVLVADDEPIIRNVYKNIVDWENHGFLLVGEARNGQEALDVLLQESVDIVITDLKMPVMDGLSLIRRAKERKSHLKFVVVSGFDEFHLVREAYRLGVCDYLIKTELTPESVLETTCRLGREIEVEREQNQRKNERDEQYEKMERVLFLNRMVLREKLLKELFFRGGGKDIGKELRSQGILLEETGLSVLSIQLEEYYRIEQELYSGDRELFKYAISNVLEELLGDFHHSCQFCNRPHEYVIAFSVDDLRGFQKRQKRILNFFLVLQREMERCFGFKISGGSSMVADGYASCKKLYRQADVARSYSFIKGKGHLIGYEEVAFLSAGSKIEIDNKIKLLKEILKMLDSECVRREIDKLTIPVADLCLSSIDEVKELFQRYYCEIYDCAKQNEFYLQVEDRLNVFNHNLKEFGDIGELNAWLTGILEEIAYIIQSDKVITKAKSFIQSNYEKNISLADVASSLHISSRHFSRIFTKTTGMSFTEYLLKVRMDEAISLMQNENLKVYEIAERVGYTNVEQFSRMFKKVLHKSPREYLRYGTGPKDKK